MTYSFNNYSEYAEIKNRVDMWCPFLIGPNSTLAVPDIRTGEWCDEGYTQDNQSIMDTGDWQAMRISAHASDICDPAEYVGMGTLQGLEPGLYQCITVDGDCNCHEDEHDDSVGCDSLVGWALMKYEGE